MDSFFEGGIRSILLIPRHKIRMAKQKIYSSYETVKDGVIFMVCLSGKLVKAERYMIKLVP